LPDESNFVNKILGNETGNFYHFIFAKASKKNKEDKIPLFARISINKQRAEFSLNRVLYPNRWNSGSSKLEGHDKTSREMNSYLDTVRANLILVKREMENEGKLVTLVLFSRGT